MGITFQTVLGSGTLPLQEKNLDYVEIRTLNSFTTLMMIGFWKSVKILPKLRHGTRYH